VEDRRERVFVQQLVAEAAVEALDAAVLHRPTRLDEVRVGALWPANRCGLEDLVFRWGSALLRCKETSIDAKIETDNEDVLAGW
jgi:hypothetical protein